MEKPHVIRPSPAAGALDFHPHVACANPACGRLHPARLSIRGEGGRACCGPDCARAVGRDRFPEERETP